MRVYIRIYVLHAHANKIIYTNKTNYAGNYIDTIL